jgi:hypothetical protein
MGAAAAMRLTQLHGEPNQRSPGQPTARDGTEVPALPWPDQTPHNADRSPGNGAVLWCVHRDASCGRLPVTHLMIWVDRQERYLSRPASPA